MKSYRWYPTVLILLIIPMVLWTGCDSTDAMDDGFAVEGQVLNATERPVRGATVSLSGERQTVTTNDEGRFTLTGVSEGEYTITYEAEGYQDATRS